MLCFINRIKVHTLKLNVFDHFLMRFNYFTISIKNFISAIDLKLIA